MPNQRIQLLHGLLKERILVLDGAMGTMIQGHKLDAVHYHGDRFHGAPLRPEGQQRPADPDAAADHPRHPLGLPGGRRRPDRDQHVQLERGVHGRLRHDPSGVRVEQRRGAAGAVGCRRVHRRNDPAQAALRRRRAGAHQPHRVDLAGRERSGLSQRFLRRTGGLLRRMREGAARRRRRSADGRDGVRHA